MDADGEAMKKLLSFALFLWARKLNKKEEIKENYTTTFNNLKPGFICQSKKTILMIEYFAIYWTYKGASKNPFQLNKTFIGFKSC